MATKLTYDEIKSKINEEIEKVKQSGEIDKPLTPAQKTRFAPLAKRLLCERWPQIT